MKSDMITAGIVANSAPLAAASNDKEKRCLHIVMIPGIGTDDAFFDHAKISLLEHFEQKQSSYDTVQVHTYFPYGNWHRSVVKQILEVGIDMVKHRSKSALSRASIASNSSNSIKSIKSSNLSNPSKSGNPSNLSNPSNSGSASNLSSASSANEASIARMQQPNNDGRQPPGSMARERRTGRLKKLHEHLQQFVREQDDLLLFTHSGGGVLAYHLLRLWVREGRRKPKLLQIGCPRIPIADEDQANVLYLYAADKSKGWSDPVSRLGSWGGWERRFRLFPYWNRRRYAPQSLVSLHIIGGHPDYFRLSEGYRNEQGQTNYDITLAAIDEWLAQAQK